MTAKLTDLDGVGPARSESLEEAGYDSVEAIAEADSETLAEDAEVPEDTALGFIVQSQNIIEDAEDAEDDSAVPEKESVEEEDEDAPMPADLAEPDEEESSDDSEDADADAEESDEAETYTLVVDLETDLHYDAYMTALLNAYERRYGSHQPTLNAVSHVLDDARYNSGEVTHELTEFELNSMHAAISQQATDYKGDNMIDHMDAMNDILAQVNEVREEKLF